MAQCGGPKSSPPSAFSPLSRLHCSFKTAAIFLCASNLLVAVYVLNSIVGPFFMASSSASVDVILRSKDSPLRVVRYSENQWNHIKEAIDIWKASEPVELIKRVREIEEEAIAAELKRRQYELARDKVASDLAERLKELQSGSTRNHWKALQEWREKKLEEARRRHALFKGKIEDLSAMEAARDAAEAVKVLQSGWNSLLEEMGWSEPEIEDDIPEGLLPPECRVETHTDYAGAAVRWGLTHHVGSAAECCQACLDQAKYAKSGEKKCNIWVYCPSEKGCYSPDKYEHKKHECWLKQDDKPRLYFEGQYTPEYRKQHPTAPVYVPWISGVVQA